MALRDRLAEAAQAGMTFRDWMDACLYDEAEGYYTRRRDQPRTGTGQDADFATAPTIHPFMARCIAREIHATWQDLGRPTDFFVVEYGGGEGDLARDALHALHDEHGWHPTWHHVEISPDHVQAQQQGTHTPDEVVATDLSTQATDSDPDPPGAGEEDNGGGPDDGDGKGDQANDGDKSEGDAGPAQVEGATDMRFGPAPESFTGVVVAHEFLDALPVHLMEWRKGHWAELYVWADGGNVRLGPGFPTQAGSDAAPKIEAAEGHRVVAHAGAKSWLADVGKRLQAGRVVVVDYGSQEDLWRRDPEWGTLRTFRGQQHGASPLEDPGEQDITASLDFGQLRAWAGDTGLHEVSYETQEAFLMRHGALEAMNAIDRDSVEGASSYLRLRQLLLPTVMGEAFRVALYEKGMG